MNYFNEKLDDYAYLNRNQPEGMQLKNLTVAIIVLHCYDQHKLCISYITHMVANDWYYKI